MHDERHLPGLIYSHRFALPTRAQEEHRRSPEPQEAVALPTRAQEELDHGAIAAAYAMTPTLSDTVKSASVQALMSSTV